MTERGIQHAMCFSLGGRPHYNVASFLAAPRAVLRPVCAMDFNGVPPSQISARFRAGDPLTAALHVCGATEASPRDFRMLGSDRELRVTLSPKDYNFRTRPARPVRVGGKHHWHMQVRSAPNASGDGLKEATSVICAPPDHRRATVHEPMVALPAPGMVNRPPTARPGASIGLPGAWYQSTEVAFGSRDADGPISAVAYWRYPRSLPGGWITPGVLVRLIGITFRGRSGSRRELDRAKAGLLAPAVLLSIMWRWHPPLLWG